MPWIEVNKMDQRLQFVIRSLDPFENFTKLCREFNISAKTGYKWKQRFLIGGIPALEDQPRKPQTNYKAVPEDVICEIIRIKNSHKGWGPKKVREIYKTAHQIEYIPCQSSVERILKKAGLVAPKKRRANAKDTRIQNRVTPEHPNHVWTVDFKGWWYTPNNEKCEPLTVRDEFSKYILDINLPKKGDTYHVKKRFEYLFSKYGLPNVIRSDNGPPFATALARWGLTKLAAWWMFLGISLDRIDPGAPYQNGGHERMHLDIKRELEHKIKGDLKTHQAMFEQWRKEFNQIRPHEALDMKTPAQVYEKSKIKYDVYDDIQYEKNFIPRLVNNRGCTNYRGHRIFIGNAFNGYSIGILEKPDHQSMVYFNKLLLGTIDRRNFFFTPEKNLR